MLRLTITFPSFEGGDEHYITLLQYDSDSGKIQYTGTTWNLLTGSWRIDSSIAGGTIYVVVQLDKCVHPGLELAILTLHAEISYWFSRPDSVSDPGWEGSIDGTKYALTSTTP